LEAFYSDFQALFGVSIDAARGEAVAVIGANGAGKSTLLKSIAGLLRARPDAITFAGEPIGGMPAYAGAARGIALVAGGQGAFALAERRRKSVDRRPARPAGRLDAAANLRIVSCSQPTAQTAEHGAVRRPAADGRARPRADGQSAIAVVRRNQPGAGADRGARNLCAAAGGARRRHRDRFGRAGRGAGARRRVAPLLFAGGGGW